MHAWAGYLQTYETLLKELEVYFAVISSTFKSLLMIDVPTPYALLNFRRDLLMVYLSGSISELHRIV
jgi:hypothetical protein